MGIFLPSLCVRAVKLNGRICRFGALGDFKRMFKGGRGGDLYLLRGINCNCTSETETETLSRLSLVVTRRDGVAIV